MSPFTESLEATDINVTSDVLADFLDVCAASPQRVAARDGTTVYTYTQLLHRTERIADALRQAGIGRGSIVGILQPQGIDLIASLLATLHVGAAYVPLDHRLPEERLSYILTDSRAVIILASQNLVHHLPGGKTPKVLPLETLDFSEVSKTSAPAHTFGDDPAYVIYTSGSTGTPKGVVVSRANLSNYCNWASRTYVDEAGDRFALYSPLSFDFTATCIYPPLMRGCAIEIYDGITNPFVVKDILDDNRVHVLKITPSYLEVFAELVDEDCQIKKIIVGGEDLSASLAARVYEKMGGRVALINEYGPTEATVGCMVHVFDPQRDQAGSVSIGRGIDNTEILLLDDRLQPVTPSAGGEICIAGPSVALGYLNRPDLTEKSFCRLPDQPAKRIYRTGDYARMRSNGDLVFAGRMDDQVKIRGFRVELGEIESVLRAMPQIRSVHVTTVDYGSTHDLLAAVVPNTPVGAQDISAELGRHLPAYMIPPHIFFLDELPLTPNQKADRTAILKAWENQK